MNIQKQAVQEYLMKGYTYRQLAEKYGVSRCTINRWVLVHQAIHGLPRNKRQHSYDLQQMSKPGKSKQKQVALTDAEQRIAFLEK
jgi:transposase-like protein